MDCCSEWVPDVRFHVVATFPVQSPTKKKTQNHKTNHIAPMPLQSSLLDVLTTGFFCFHLDNLLTKTPKCCYIKYSVNIVEKD